MQINKEESIKWINHAISFYEGLEKNQKELAEYLGIAESRISELKNPNKTLKVSNNQIQQIIQLCGSPKRGPGRFEYVELYNNLADFFEYTIPVTLNRYHRVVAEYFSSRDTLDEILNSISFQSSIKNEQIQSINKLVRTQEFQSLCNESDFKSKVDDLLRTDKCTFNAKPKNSKIFHILHLLTLFVNEHPSFELDTTLNKTITPLKPSIPIVLTGHRITAFLPEDRSFTYPINKQIQKELKIEAYNSLELLNSHELPQLDKWKSIRVEIYLSENMNYHILIHMSVGDMRPLDLNYIATTDQGNKWCNYDTAIETKDRLAVIKNINSLDLFNTIEELRKWQGLPQDNLYELKQEIAKAGGYIPGAQVLV